MTTSSIIRQNYNEEIAAGINMQINIELYASYVYMSMAYHFDRDDVALEGFHKFFKKQSDEERRNTEKLMKFQNQCDGRIKLKDVKVPGKDEWGTRLKAMEAAFALEKHVYEALLPLRTTAGNHNDAQKHRFH